MSTRTPPGPATAPDAGRARHLVVAVAGVSAALMYVDRVCLSILGAYIPEELGLTPRQWAWALGAFFWTYALGQVPAGWLGDRLGPRRMLTVDILAWSACTAATGLVGGFAGLLLARLACGLAQAGAYPSSAALLRRRVPASRRARASGFVALGGRLGASLAPPLTALLVIALVPAEAPRRIGPGDLPDARRLAVGLLDDSGPFRAFRQAVRPLLPADARAALLRLKDRQPVPADPTSLRSGLNRLIDGPALTEGLAAARPLLPREVAAILALPDHRRSPAQIQRLNRLALEAAAPGGIRQLYGGGWRPVLFVYGAAGLVVSLLVWITVRDGPAPAADPGRSAIPGAGVARRLVASRNLWLSGLTQAGINIGWAFLITLLPTYLAETYRVPLEARGRMVAVPTLVGSLGMIAGGFLSDRLVRSIGLRWGRALPISLTLFGCALTLLACRWLPTAWAVVGALGVMAALVDMGVPSLWAFAQDIGGRDVGAVLGWGNMWANLGAALSPVLLATVREAYGWNAAFATCSLSFLIAGLAGLGLDASKPLR